MTMVEGGVFGAALQDARQAYPKFSWRYLAPEAGDFIHRIEAGIDFRSQLGVEEIVLLTGDSPHHYLHVMTDEVGKRLQYEIDKQSSDFNKVIFRMVPCRHRDRERG